MADDLISRQALLEHCSGLPRWDGKDDYTEHAMLDRDDVLCSIENAPSIEAVPVRNGHKVYHNRPAKYEHYEMAQQTENGEPLYKRQYYTLQDNPVAYCSECGKRLCSRFTNYCPNCGARMDGGADNG